MGQTSGCARRSLMKLPWRGWWGSCLIWRLGRGRTPVWAPGLLDWGLGALCRVGWWLPSVSYHLPPSPEHTQHGTRLPLGEARNVHKTSYRLFVTSSQEQPLCSFLVRSESLCTVHAERGGIAQKCDYQELGSEGSPHQELEGLRGGVLLRCQECLWCPKLSPTPTPIPGLKAAFPFF